MNEIIFAIIVTLIPGIIATIISDKLTNHSKWNSFKFSLYAFVLGIMAYVFLQITVYIYDIIKNVSLKLITFNHLEIWSSFLNGVTAVKAWEICAATFFSIPVAFFASALINHKIFNKIAQKINVTNKYGDENLYSFYLNAKEIDWIYVRDPKNNFTYQGRVFQHSENDNIQEIVLSEVSVYRYEDSKFLYSVPTIYLSRGIGEFIIEAIPNNNLGEKDESEKTIK
jgi:hypothetical protein